ncbi:MAG: alpha-glucosidase/alpha-galactosidase [Candidatus Bathyarchaeia archaeon]
MAQISIIGAGSVMFSMAFIRDLCITKSLAGSTVTLMDINKERLDMIYNLAQRYKKEVKADITFNRTTNRKEALQGSDFVISTVMVIGYDAMETEREIAERHGYYRGIGDRVFDYYGGVGAYSQLRFFLDLARDMEDLCPDAWLIETANPVFEGVNLITRETKVKTVGVCHGHFATEDMIKVLGLDVQNCRVQTAGFNHCIWLTHFLYKGENAYSIIDEWIENKAEEYWKSEKYLSVPPWESEQMSPGAVDTYKMFGLFPIGDTVRSMSPWWHHTDLKTKQRWYGPTGGFDSEIGWKIYLDRHDEKMRKMSELAEDPSSSLIGEFPPIMSGEQHIPIIDAIANDKETILQLNIPNKGAISGIPDDVVVEIPTLVSGRGIQGIHVGGLPKRLMLYGIVPRMRRMEQILHAFLNGDRKSLLLMLMEDPRTKSFEQAERLLKELLAQPWNAEAEKHYR